ncbi:MAG: PTS ascorbate transporter subunit IIC [Candidatus Limnocylindrus sp.]
MDINAIATFLLNNLFNQVALLVGIFVAIGLLAQGKGARLTIEGTVRAALGYVILGVGIDVFIGGLIAFQNVVGAAFGITPPTSTNTLSGFLQTSGSAVALIMAGGYLVHLILGRILRTKFVYLTGHLMYWISVVIAVSVYQSVPGANAVQVALFGSVISGIYWTVQPAIMQRFMKKITGNNDVGFAHTSSLACYLASIFGKYVGDPKKENAESMKLPGWLGLFKDINVSTSLVISLILLASAAAVVVGPADDAVVTGAAGSLAWPVWAVVTGLKFAAGIAVLLYGVRLFLAEVVPAFKGISDRVLPGAKPALDVPVVFSYAPTAVMIGFLSSTVVFLAFMLGFGAAGVAAIIPPMIMLFFPGGGAGVFGNAVGGWKGAVLGGAINGAILAVGQALFYPALSGTAPEVATLADPDWYLISAIVMPIADLLKSFFGG